MLNVSFIYGTFILDPLGTLHVRRTSSTKSIMVFVIYIYKKKRKQYNKRSIKVIIVQKLLVHKLECQMFMDYTFRTITIKQKNGITLQTIQFYKYLKIGLRKKINTNPNFRRKTIHVLLCIRKLKYYDNTSLVQFQNTKDTHPDNRTSGEKHSYRGAHTEP